MMVDDTFVLDEVSEFNNANMGLGYDTIELQVQGSLEVSGVELNEGLGLLAGASSTDQHRTSIENIAVTFSDSLGAVSASQVTLINHGVDPLVSDAEVIPLSDADLSVSGDRLMISFYDSEPLADGVYELVIDASVTSLSGASLGNDWSYRGDAQNRFFRLGGDLNGDASVDLLDLDILSQNYGLTGATAGDGDLNGDSNVDLLDLDVLAAKFSDRVDLSNTVLLGQESLAASTGSDAEASAATPIPVAVTSAAQRALDTAFALFAEEDPEEEDLEMTLVGSLESDAVSDLAWESFS